MTEEEVAKARELLEAVERLKLSISYIAESPYTCSQCHMFNAEGERCDNPVAPFLTEPGGYCALFAPSPLAADPDDPRAWLLFAKLKGPKTT